jgi:hypothetical protein
MATLEERKRSLNKLDFSFVDFGLGYQDDDARTVNFLPGSNPVKLGGIK